MIVACKCGHCGHIEMSAEAEVTFEFDFLEKRVLYICSKCKKSNVINFDSDAQDKKRMPLPGIRVC